MVVIQEDKKIRNVKLTGDQIRIVIDDIQRLPYNTYTWFNYSDIVKILNDALEESVE